MVAGRGHPYTEKEMDFLLLVGNGNDVTVIALRFKTTPGGVYSMRRNIAEKYGADAEGLVFDALERGWILLDREVRFMGY